jgi:LacI family transcriptional regulator
VGIDPSSDTPLYQQVADDLRRQIRSGALPPGARLPPIRQLTTLYGVSIITINKAMAALVSDGLVDSHVGRGSFVTNLSTPDAPRVIGFVLRDLSSPFFARVAAGAQARAEAEGFEIFVTSSAGDLEREETHIERLRSLGADALIIASLRPTAPTLRMLRQADVPVVMVSHTDEEDVPFVGTDPRRAGEIAAEHFLRLGRQRLGYVNGRPGRPSGEQVREGYRSVIEREGGTLAPELEWSYPGSGSGESHQYRSGYAVGEEVAALEEKPDAVLVFNDLGAIGFIDALLDGGVDVPSEIAVMGIDGIEQGARARVPLTTIRQPAERIGELAVETLLRRLRGERFQVRQFLEPELVVRRSCGASLDGPVVGGRRTAP